MMQLISVNLGTVRAMPTTVKRHGTTGIFKQPVSDPVHIETLGLADDAICDVESHGGVDQAVYVYGSADYDWWAAELGCALEPGTFGENLTISELVSGDLRIGDRLRVGEVLLEVTSPRIPCATFAYRMDDPQWVKKFRHAERPGVYCRVIETGAVQAGDPVTLEPYQGETILALEMFRSFYDKSLRDADYLRRAIAAPTHYKDRAQLVQELDALNSRSTAG